MRTLPLFTGLVLAIAPCPGTAPAEAPAPARSAGAEERAEAPARTEEARASETPAPAEATPATPEAPAPLPDAPLVRVEPPQLSPMTPRVAATIRAVAERAERRDDVFAVMGGSSSVSRAFMACFAGDEWDLAGFADELGATVAFFRGGNAGGTSPYSRGRSSEAARVGWSLRNVLGGTPTRIQREVRAISPRYALLLFGGNDVEGRNPRVWGRRLETAIGQLVSAGVVPIVGATLPRNDVDFMDAWAQRYNVVSRGIAEAWGVPYVDYYDAVHRLRGRGLARDGVHPNVLRDGRRGRGCVLSDEGLRFGHNVRNLLTLRALEAAREVVAGEPAPVAEVPPPAGD
ncbi:MAG: GDSL-type esterase/lipase family protein, partial [Myxococcota bacterium]